jgi:hypothetical protein
MCDALASNTAEGCTVVEAHCIPHARRYWVDQLQNHPQQCTYVLTRLALVFKVEAQSRADRLCAEERLRLHREQSQPGMDELKAWMERQFEQRLVLGQQHGRKSAQDGNPSPPQLALLRNARGARVGDGYMSVLYTAELNGENSFVYLVALLRHPDAVAKTPRDWLPWTYRATLARIADSGAGERPNSARAGPPSAREDERPAA